MEARAANWPVALDGLVIYTGHMRINAAEFKAKCLALLDQVGERGEAITITKRGRVVARLVPAQDDGERPWERLRGKARWTGDPFAPVLDESEILAIE
jgi:prevent-host-death family protein